ncbi:hypothetical protein OCU04_003746 [Sclerotinia nivalis]|uniref:Condensation domain-containing protein n=1 Tax=Sclerotinia nivalis TaxID=352851 RepID=A0A9X0DLN1_9HELO|nr:hypothetical protein OCU04_003746 [Sclerotinia nivalis]
MGVAPFMSHFIKSRDGLSSADRLVPGLEVDQDSVAIQDQILGSPSPQETVNGPGTASSSDTENPNDSIKISSVVSSDINESVDGNMPSSPIQKTLELSFSQDMFWFVWKFLTDKTSLNHTAWARITGKIRIEDFRKGMHEDVRFLQGDNVYNVAEGQTVRVMLLSLSPKEYFFVAGLHPVIADGKFENGLKFWKAEVATLPPPLPILTISKAISRPTLTTYENVKADITIDSETKAKIQALCRQYKTTTFHFYLAVFSALPLRFAPAGDGEDIAIGVGDRNRTEDEMDVIGPFVNLLPLRLRSHAAATFSYSMRDTRDKVFAALAHSQVPFQVLLNK